MLTKDKQMEISQAAFNKAYEHDTSGKSDSEVKLQSDTEETASFSNYFWQHLKELRGEI